jgi:hypothetical protein
MAKVAENILGGKHHVPDPGRGTRVSGYVESDVPRSCGTCEYLSKGTLCRKRTVLRDPQLQTDANTGLKIVDPVFGCCNLWHQSEEAEARAAKGDFEKALLVVIQK